MNDEIALLVFTDGRVDYLRKTFSSWETNCVAWPATTIIIDDSADPNYGAWLDSNYGRKVTRIIHHMRRLGFGGTIRETWNDLPPAADWFFHLEDDFVLNRKLDIRDMLKVMQANPHLAQMCLLRQPWNENEAKAGGVWQQRPESMHERDTEGLKWIEHKEWFSTNPCLYPRWLVDVGWPEDDYHCEGMFGFKIWEARPDARSAYWGSKTDSPIVHHIGIGRIGIGY